MAWVQPLLALALVLGGAQALAQRRPAVPTVPALPKGDLQRGLQLLPPEGGFSARVGYRGDELLVRVEVPGAAEGGVELSIHFPKAGTTAGGHTWRVGPEGLVPAPLSPSLPPHAQRLTRAKVERSEQGLVVELAIPARALPRFPAKEPLLFDLCIGAGKVSNCTAGSMPKGPLRLPDDFRKRLGLSPNPQVVGVEGRETGWVGYAHLHYPAWLRSDRPLDAQVLRALVADELLVDARSAGINVPDQLLLPDQRRLLSVVAGRNPYVSAGKCDSDLELRLGLYLVQGQTADRVLDWPAATCALGRAVAFELEDGELHIGYTNGATVTFQWFKDRFERTEIGRR